MGFSEFNNVKVKKCKNISSQKYLLVVKNRKELNIEFLSLPSNLKMYALI